MRYSNYIDSLYIVIVISDPEVDTGEGTGIYSSNEFTCLHVRMVGFVFWLLS